MKNNVLIVIACLILHIPVQMVAQRPILKDCIHTYSESRIEPNGTGWAYWFIPAGGVADTLSVKMSMVDKGVKTHEPHSHFEDELFYMVEGEAIVYMNGEEQRLQPGDAFYAPGNSWHNIRRTDMNQRIRYVMFKRELKGKLKKPFLPGKTDYKMADCYVPFSERDMKKQKDAQTLCYLSKDMSDNGLNVTLWKTSQKNKIKKTTKQAVYFLLKGEADVRMNGEKCNLLPLSSIYVPSGAKFSIQPVNKGVLEYLVVYTK